VSIYKRQDCALVPVLSISHLGEDICIKITDNLTLTCPSRDLFLVIAPTDYCLTTAGELKEGDRFWFELTNKSGHPSSLEDQNTMRLLADPLVLKPHGVLAQLKELQCAYIEVARERDAWQKTAIRQKIHWNNGKGIKPS